MLRIINYNKEVIYVTRYLGCYVKRCINLVIYLIKAHIELYLDVAISLGQGYVEYLI